VQLFQPLHYPDLCLPDDYEGESQHFWICAPVCVNTPLPPPPPPRTTKNTRGGEEKDRREKKMREIKRR